MTVEGILYGKLIDLFPEESGSYYSNLLTRSDTIVFTFCIRLNVGTNCVLTCQCTY